MLPNQAILEQISRIISHIPNRKGEYKRNIHKCCYLLCHQSGLRISEAIKFNPKQKTKQGLYRIEKPKGKKERFVYIPNKVINELKKNNWQPNQTNRFTFYHFLRKIKREIKINANIELSPHTLRRSFTTYHAESGMPLPLLQKLLWHSSIRTTALYWKNIYGDETDITDILTGKNWLERFAKSSQRKKPSQNPKPVELPKLPKKVFVADNSVTPIPKVIERNIFVRDKKQDSIVLKAEKIPPNISIARIYPQEAEIKEISIPITINEDKEQILLEKVSNLEERLKQLHEENKVLVANLDDIQMENKNLTIKLIQQEEIIKQERKRANNYEQQLQAIAQAFQQWQKINYYKQLERENKVELEAQIVQQEIKIK